MAPVRLVSATPTAAMMPTVERSPSPMGMRGKLFRLASTLYLLHDGAHDGDVVQDFLDGLTSRGFTDDQAVTAYRSFTSFLLGHLLLESAALGASTAPVEEPLNEGDAALPNADADVEVAKYPAVARLRDQLSEDHTDDGFEEALEAYSNAWTSPSASEIEPGRPASTARTSPCGPLNGQKVRHHPLSLALQPLRPSDRELHRALRTGKVKSLGVGATECRLPCTRPPPRFARASSHRPEPTAGYSRTVGSGQGAS